MKIALLSHQFPPQTGGIGQWAFALASCWRDACECFIPHLTDQNYDTPGIKTQCVNTDQNLYLTQIRQLKHELASLQQLSQEGHHLWRSLTWVQVRETLNWLIPLMKGKNHWDGILSSATAPTGIAGTLAANITGRPHAILVHGAELLAIQSDHHRNQCTTSILKQADLCVANSHFTADLLRANGINNNRIMISHPGVSSSLIPQIEHRFKKESRGNKGPVLMTVANLIPRKGHHRVIQMLPVLINQFPDLQYYIVGQGPEKQRLQLLAEQLQVSEHCIFTGRVTVSQLHEYYKKADCFIMPGRQIGSEVEGFGIAFVEASAHGLPVIGSDIGGCHDAIKDGITGYLVAQDNDDDLFNKTHKLLSDVNLRHAMGREGHHWVASHVTWQHGADEIYRRFAQLHKPGVCEK